jgi:CheY-like chemotaxis protein
LVVDDEKGLIKVAVSYLEDLGYKTLTATSGKLALEVLQKQHQIDLVFSDVVMPGDIDGYNLGKEVLKNHPDTKVLLTSGFTSKRETAVNGDKPLMEKLSRNLLNKPYNQTELAMAVRRTLEENYDIEQG